MTDDMECYRIQSAVTIHLIRCAMDDFSLSVSEGLNGMVFGRDDEE